MAYDGTKPPTGGDVLSADLRENFRALKDDQIVDGLLETGTRIVVYQATAPNGFTQVAGVNDQVIRIVQTGAGTTGGNWSMAGLSIDGHALTEAEMPSHNHGNGSLYTSGNGGHTHDVRVDTGSGGNEIAAQAAESGSFSSGRISSVGDHTHSILGSTATAGSDNAHTHGITNSSWRPAHLNCLVVEKT